MFGLLQAQGAVLLLLGVAALAVEVFALVEALRFRRDAYPAAGKQSKPVWVTITAVAALIGFVSVRSPLGFGAIAAAAAIVFVVGVRPALRQVQGRGGTTSRGPYGGW